MKTRSGNKYSEEKTSPREETPRKGRAKEKESTTLPKTQKAEKQVNKRKLKSSAEDVPNTEEEQKDSQIPVETTRKRRAKEPESTALSKSPKAAKQTNEPKLESSEEAVPNIEEEPKDNQIPVETTRKRRAKEPESTALPKTPKATKQTNKRKLKSSAEDVPNAEEEQKDNQIPVVTARERRAKERESTALPKAPKAAKQTNTRKLKSSVEAVPNTEEEQKGNEIPEETKPIEEIIVSDDTNHKEIDLNQTNKQKLESSAETVANTEEEEKDNQKLKSSAEAVPNAEEEQKDNQKPEETTRERRAKERESKASKIPKATKQVNKRKLIDEEEKHLEIIEESVEKETEVKQTNRRKVIDKQKNDLSANVEQIGEKSSLKPKSVPKTKQKQPESPHKELTEEKSSAEPIPNTEEQQIDNQIPEQTKPIEEITVSDDTNHMEIDSNQTNKRKLIDEEEKALEIIEETPKKLRVSRFTVPSIPQICGQLYSFGEEIAGELGLRLKKVDDIKVKSNEPSIVTDKEGLTLDNIVSVVCGAMHSCCLTSEGEVITFGCNDDSALGRDTLTGSDETDDSIDVDESEEKESRTPRVVSGLTPIVKITAGDMHTCALSKDGSVYVWGNFK